MRDIDKAVKLYGMMADRCEKSGFAPRQAQVYREMAELMHGCETTEEASVKIRNSKYWLAPGAARMQDKFAALEKASRENGMFDVAGVYQKKIAEIDADPRAMYETGCEQTAMNLKIPYIRTYEAFAQIYECYLILSCCNVHDERKIKSTIKNLNDSLTKLSKPSSDFAALAALDKFRELIPANDEGYACFVKAVPRLSANGPDFGAERKQIEEEFASMLEILSSEKNAVMETGKINRAKYKRSEVIVIPPDSKDGTYTYAGEEVTDYE